MRLPAVLRAAEGTGHERRLQHDALAVHVERDGLGGHDLAGAHGALQEAGHLGGSLDGRDLGRVHPGRVDARVQLADAREHDAGLAEGRQHGLDVLEEGPAGTHDEHARGREAVTVRVEEVRGAVQRDRGLAGARPALHDEHAAEAGADDAVLLGLDGGDDVVHPAGAARGERGEQRALALEAGAALVEERRVEHLVLDVHDLAAVRREVATRAGAERGGGGGLVEGAGLGHAPVEEQRLEVVVAEADAADVPVDGIPVAGRARGRAVAGLVLRQVAVLELEAAEDEALVDLAERLQAVLVDARERVALGAVLVRSSGGAVAHRRQLVPGLRAHRVESPVEAGDVRPLALQLRTGHLHTPWNPASILSSGEGAD